MKKVTMSDIARELGISTVSVSKALSDKEGVSDEVRERVKKKAEEMRYRYNSFARNMRDGVNNNIGVLVSEHFFSDDAFYYGIYQMLVRDLSKKKYSCILEILSYSDEKQGVLPNMITNSKVDGLIILGQMRQAYIEQISKEWIPYIFLDFYDEHGEVDSIISDGVHGAYLLTNYLIEKGYRRIGYVGNIHATSSIMDRYMGYYKALMQKHISFQDEWIINDRDDETGAYIQMKLPEEMPDAFVCNCDEAAYHFMSQLREAGYRVPEDIAIVGFDDSVFARLCSPMLTTFHVDFARMSKTAADTIIKKANDDSYHIEKKVIGGEIVIRDSVLERK